MKTVLFLLATCIACFSCQAAPKKVEAKKRFINPYKIVSSEKDSTLDENHAVFELSFSESLVLAQESIELSCNGVISRFLLTDAKNQEIMVSPGSYLFMLSAGDRYEEIITDSVFIHPGYRTIIEFKFQPIPEIER